MTDAFEPSQRTLEGPAPSVRPARMVSLALVVLGAFEIGRLVSGVLIGPWLSELLLGIRTPVMVGNTDLSRVAIEVLAIAIGVGLAALIAVPIAKLLVKDRQRRMN